MSWVQISPEAALLGKRGVVFGCSCLALLCLNDWTYMYMYLHRNPDVTGGPSKDTPNRYVRHMIKSMRPIQYKARQHNNIIIGSNCMTLCLVSTNVHIASLRVLVCVVIRPTFHVVLVLLGGRLTDWLTDWQTPEEGSIAEMLCTSYLCHSIAVQSIRCWLTDWQCTYASVHG